MERNRYSSEGSLNFGDPIQHRTEKLCDIIVKSLTGFLSRKIYSSNFLHRLTEKRLKFKVLV